MKVAIVTFPGSNCDYDCFQATREIMKAEAHFVWHRERDLGDCDAVFLPGGFSYGDYLRAGAIARFSPIMAAVRAFADEGGPVVGICNGFQVLCEAGMLPGALVRNRSLRFQGERVRARVETTETPFTSDYTLHQVLSLHIAHGQGNYVADTDTLDQLEEEGRVVLRYVDAAGEPTDGGNANGSLHNIAGIISAEGNVLGLMPHPERSVDPLLGPPDGRALFTSLAAHIGGPYPGAAVPAAAEGR